MLALQPHDAGHVLVYQSNSTHRALVDFLRAATDRICYVYGYDRTEGREGNVVFMRKSEEGFLRLLEGCAYVIQGGGHTLMGEALHLGKPILTLPLKAMVEQRFNALYIERLGYGMQADMLTLKPDLLRRFEANLPAYRAVFAAMKLSSAWWTTSFATARFPPAASRAWKNRGTLWWGSCGCVEPLQQVETECFTPDDGCFFRPYYLLKYISQKIKTRSLRRLTVQINSYTACIHS